MLFCCSSQATRLKGNSSKSKSNKSAHSFASLLPIIMIKHMHCSGLSAYEIPHLSEHFPRTNKVYPIWQGLMHFLSLKKRYSTFRDHKLTAQHIAGFLFIVAELSVASGTTTALWNETNVSHGAGCKIYDDSVSQPLPNESVCGFMCIETVGIVVLNSYRTLVEACCKVHVVHWFFFLRSVWQRWFAWQLIRWWK